MPRLKEVVDDYRHDVIVAVNRNRYASTNIPAVAMATIPLAGMRVMFMLVPETLTSPTVFKAVWFPERGTRRFSWQHCRMRRCLGGCNTCRTDSRCYEYPYNAENNTITL